MSEPIKIGHTPFYDFSNGDLRRANTPVIDYAPSEFYGYSSNSAIREYDPNREETVYESDEMTLEQAIQVLNNYKYRYSDAHIHDHQRIEWFLVTDVDVPYVALIRYDKELLEGTRINEDQYHSFSLWEAQAIAEKLLREGK